MNRMTKDCDCDAGVKDNGICPDCFGVGWYIIEADYDIIAWVIATDVY